MTAPLLFALVAIVFGWPCSWRVSRIPPPIPEWLKNDPETEAAARLIVEQWRRHHSAIATMWGPIRLPR